MDVSAASPLTGCPFLDRQHCPFYKKGEEYHSHGPRDAASRGNLDMANMIDPVAQLKARIQQLKQELEAATERGHVAEGRCMNQEKDLIALNAKQESTEAKLLDEKKLRLGAEKKAEELDSHLKDLQATLETFHSKIEVAERLRQEAVSRIQQADVLKEEAAAQVQAEDVKKVRRLREINDAAQDLNFDRNEIEELEARVSLDSKLLKESKKAHDEEVADFKERQKELEAKLHDFHLDRSQFLELREVEDAKQKQMLRKLELCKEDQKELEDLRAFVAEEKRTMLQVISDLQTELSDAQKASKDQQSLLQTEMEEQQKEMDRLKKVEEESRKWRPDGDPEAAETRATGLLGVRLRREMEDSIARSVQEAEKHRYATEQLARERGEVNTMRQDLEKERKEREESKQKFQKQGRHWEKQEQNAQTNYNELQSVKASKDQLEDGASRMQTELDNMARALKDAQLQRQVTKVMETDALREKSAAEKARDAALKAQKEAEAGKNAAEIAQAQAEEEQEKLEGQSQRLVRELAASRAEKAELEVAVENAQNEANKYHLEKEGADLRIATLERKYYDVAKELQEANETCERLKRSIEAKKLEKPKPAGPDLEKKAMVAQIDALKREKEGLVERMGIAEAEMERLKQENANMEAEWVEMQTREEEVRRVSIEENARHEVERDAMEKEREAGMKQMQEERKRLEEEMEVQRQKISDWEKEREQIESQQKANWESKWKEIEDEKTSLLDTAEATRKAHAEIQSKLNTFLKEKEVLQARLQDLEGEKNKFLTEKSELQQIVSQVGESTAKRDSMNAAWKSIHEEEAALKEREIHLQQNKQTFQEQQQHLEAEWTRLEGIKLDVEKSKKDAQALEGESEAETGPSQPEEDERRESVVGTRTPEGGSGIVPTRPAWETPESINARHKGARPGSSRPGSSRPGSSKPVSARSGLGPETGLGSLSPEAQLEEEMGDLRIELEASNKYANRLEEQNKDLHTDLATAKAKNEALRQEFSQLESRMEEVVNQNRALATSKQTTDDNNKALTFSNEGLKHQVEQLTTNLREVKSANQTMRQHLTQLETKHKSLSESDSQTETFTEDSQDGNADRDLRREIVELKGIIREITRKNRSLRESLAQLEQSHKIKDGPKSDTDVAGGGRRLSQQLEHAPKPPTRPSGKEPARPRTEPQPQPQHIIAPKVPLSISPNSVPHQRTQGMGFVTLTCGDLIKTKLAFQRADVKGKFSLGLEEMKTFALSNGMPDATYDDIRSMIVSVDMNASGRVEFWEFFGVQTYMAKTLSYQYPFETWMTFITQRPAILPKLPPHPAYVGHGEHHSPEASSSNAVHPHPPPKPVQDHDGGGPYFPPISSASPSVVGHRSQLSSRGSSRPARTQAILMLPEDEVKDEDRPEPGFDL